MTTDNLNDLAILAQSAVTFVTVNAILADAKKTSDSMRSTMVPILKAHQDEQWKGPNGLGKKIKTALESLRVMTKNEEGEWVPMLDLNKKEIPLLNPAKVTQWHGVFGTCFEYKILPTDSNADRFRKADSWINWNGSKVPNTYGKVHAPKPEVAPTVNTLPTAPTAPTAPVKAPADKAVLPKTNVNGSEVISQFEHWETLSKQFTDHGLFNALIDRLAGVIHTTPESLALAFRTVNADMIAQGKALEAKSKKN